MDFKIVLSWIFCLLRTWNWYVKMIHRLLFWSSSKISSEKSNDSTSKLKLYLKLRLTQHFNKVQPTDQYENSIKFIVTNPITVLKDFFWKIGSLFIFYDRENSYLAAPVSKIQAIN